jgi:YfiH family protein
MLQARVKDGVRIYVSPLLEAAGVPHAFSTRIGGVSAPPFDSMNLGNPNGCDVQDLTPNIAANYQRLMAAIGCAGRDRLYTHQVHGGVVYTAAPGEPFDINLKGDALVTADPARVLSIRVADCVPVLLASRDGRVVAAAHAGWRGVIAQVVPNAIDAMQAIRPTLEPTDILAAIGPSIGAENFEVGPEVLAEFERDFPAPPIRPYTDGSGKGTVDLRGALRQQLISLGVPADHVDTTDRCTVRDKGEFFSHRRDNGVTGRMAALICPAKRTP